MDNPWQNGNLYDNFMGRWSRLAAQKLLTWLAMPPGLRWLDVGCGTGSLTRLILETCQPAHVTAVDASAEFIAHARRTITHPSVDFKVGLAQSLELDTDSIDALVSGLMLNFVPQPSDALAEMLRVTRPGGTIGIFVWDYAEGMQMLRYFWDAAVQLNPQAREVDEGPRFPLCRQGQLESLARQSGLKQVEAAALEVPTIFRDFDDYWLPFLGGVGPGPAYVMSLDQANRQKLEDQLRKSLPIAADGSISLTARAWAVRGMA